MGTVSDCYHQACEKVKRVEGNGKTLVNTTGLAISVSKHAIGTVYV